MECLVRPCLMQTIKGRRKEKNGIKEKREEGRKEKRKRKDEREGEREE